MVVVVVVVATSFAVIVVGCRYLRERYRRLECMENLHQLARAFALYANDNTNRFPCGASSVFLNAAMQSEYQRSPEVLVCPSSNKKPAASFRDPNASDAANVSYTQQVPPLNGKAMGLISGADPNDVIFWDQGVAGRPCGSDGGKELSWTKLSNHRGDGGNVVFGDIHVAWCTTTPTNMTLGCLNP